VWSDSAFEHRRVEGTFEALRHLGVPPVLLAIVRWAHKTLVTVRGLRRGLTRRSDRL
jgi:hypothetical protein